MRQIIYLNDAGDFQILEVSARMVLSASLFISI